MPLHVSSACAHHQEVKIALHSLWYHHTYRCDDTRGYVMQFWPPDDEHMRSKHVEAWNKLIVKQKFYASSWLITEIYWDARSAKRQKQKCLVKFFSCIRWAIILQQLWLQWLWNCSEEADHCIFFIFIMSGTLNIYRWPKRRIKIKY